MFMFTNLASLWSLYTKWVQEAEEQTLQSLEWLLQATEKDIAFFFIFDLFFVLFMSVVKSSYHPPKFQIGNSEGFEFRVLQVYFVI